MTTESTTDNQPNLVRILVIGVLVVAAFFGAYKFASAISQPKAATTAAGVAATTNGVTGVAADPNASAGATDPNAAAGGAGCACCGSTQPTENGVTGAVAEGAATVEGNVQKISVDLSTGTYNPNVLKLKAGVPAEITFGQSTGCTGQVQSNDLGFFEDLTQGPVTVKIPAQQPGEYAFSCGMQMVFGKIVVE